MSVDVKLAKAGAVMYDVEIISAIPEPGVMRIPGIHYCGGWEDYEGMGISVVTVYDFVTSSWLVYLADNLGDLKTLINSRNVIMSFNGIRFDNNVMAANGIHIPPNKNYDLYRAISDTQPPGHKAGFSLNNMLQANGIEAKSGLGSDAPRQAQQGEWGNLITYCLGDTQKQVYLLRMACAGTMKNPKNGEYMTVKLPWELVDFDEGGIFT